MKTTNYLLALSLLLTSPLVQADMASEFDLKKGFEYALNSKEQEPNSLIQAGDFEVVSVEEVEDYYFDNPNLVQDFLHAEDSELKKYQLKVKDKRSGVLFDMTTNAFILEGTKSRRYNFERYAVPEGAYQGFITSYPSYLFKKTNPFKVVLTTDKTIDGSSNVELIPSLKMEESSLASAKEEKEQEIVDANEQYHSSLIESAISDVEADEAKKDLVILSENLGGIDLSFVKELPTGNDLMVNFAQSQLPKACLVDYKRNTSRILKNFYIAKHSRHIKSAVENLVLQSFERAYEKMNVKHNDGSPLEIEDRKESSREEGDDHYARLRANLRISDTDPSNGHMTVDISPLDLTIYKFNSFGQKSVADRDLTKFKVIIDRDGNLVDETEIDSVFIDSFKSIDKQVTNIPEVCRNDVADFFKVEQQMIDQEGYGVLKAVINSEAAKENQQAQYDESQRNLLKAIENKKRLEKITQRGGLVEQN